MKCEDGLRSFPNKEGRNSAYQGIRTVQMYDVIIVYLKQTIEIIKEIERFHNTYVSLQRI